MGRLVEPRSNSYNNKVFGASLSAFGGENQAWIGINARAGVWVYTSSGDNLGNLGFENWYPGK